MYNALATTALALTCSANPALASAQPQPVTADQAQIIDTVSTVFAAARAEDIAKFDSVIAPDFYIFANGTRFNGDAIMGAIKAQHAAGKSYDEHVTEPDIHISGDIAWIAYVNRGSITDASGTVDQSWLESAFLERKAGTWRIVFMHSTRVPAATTKNQRK